MAQYLKVPTGHILMQCQICDHHFTPQQAFRIFIGDTNGVQAERLSCPVCAFLRTFSQADQVQPGRKVDPSRETSIALQQEVLEVRKALLSPRRECDSIQETSHVSQLPITFCEDE